MRIAQILLSNVWGEVGPSALERGIGGREGALLYLSREWAKLGHEVTNFVDVEQGQRFYENWDFIYHHEARPTLGNEIPGIDTPLLNKGFHEYVPLNLSKHMLAHFPWDVAIAWECPSIFEEKQIREQVKLRIAEMQVCHFPPGQMQAAEEYCQYVAALSDWHGDFLRFSGLNKPRHTVVTLPNGVDITKYPKDEYHKGRDFSSAPLFVYSSSPDRGLWQLLQSWKYIRKDFPSAELLVAYGAKDWVEINKWSHGRAGEMAVEIQKLMRQRGVKDIGKIGQSELAKFQLKATAWLYPLDSINATESGCITAVENAAAGNPIITTNCDCMEEEFGAIGRIVRLPFDPEEYAEIVKTVLIDEDYYLLLQERGREFAEKRDWRLIAPEWIKLFNDGAK